MSTFEGSSQSQIPKKLSLSQRIKDFWLKYEKNIILAFGIILIAAITFEAGFLYGEKNKEKPVIINQAAGTPCPKAGENSDDKSNASDSQQNNQNKSENQPSIENQKCAYMASKNSDKYHLATCQLAQKIKPENKVCFSSAEEAQKRGFQAAKCCIK